MFILCKSVRVDLHGNNLTNDKINFPYIKCVCRMQPSYLNINLQGEHQGCPIRILINLSYVIEGPSPSTQVRASIQINAVQTH